MTVQFLTSARRYLLPLMLVVSSTCSWALGVSDIKLSSKLGDPLQARLMLTDVGDLNPEQVIVRLAPQAVYDQMDVARNVDILSLKFHVGEDHSVSISSSHPIKEPYLNFIIEVVWPKGQIYREYKLLLDPP